MLKNHCWLTISLRTSNLSMNWIAWGIRHLNCILSNFVPWATCYRDTEACIYHSNKVSNSNISLLSSCLPYLVYKATVHFACWSQITPPQGFSSAILALSAAKLFSFSNSFKDILLVLYSTLLLMEWLMEHPVTSCDVSWLPQGQSTRSTAYNLV